MSSWLNYIIFGENKNVFCIELVDEIASALVKSEWLEQMNVNIVTHFRNDLCVYRKPLLELVKISILKFIFILHNMVYDKHDTFVNKIGKRAFVARREFISNSGPLNQLSNKLNL